MERIIRIGIGLGNIRFGSSKPAIKKILGEPNEIDTVDVPIEDEDVSIEQWHYDELELSLSFDDYEDELLDTFAISSTDYTLNGIPLIGKSIYEIDSMIEQLNLGECGKENLSDDLENTHVYSFQESNINFWFEDEELSEIQWGPISNFEQPLIFAN